VGPSYLRHYFNTLWESVDSAGLLSATMYAPKGSEDFSAWWIRRNLCVPKERYLEAPPFVAPWIYSTPTVFMPSESNALALARPETESEERFEEWYRNISLTLKRIVDAAAGGTLALCNSYDEIRALSSRLSQGRQMRVIAQEPDDSITRIKNAFMEMAREGIDPIWLATGGAWTGLDLTDETVTEPTKDNLLTDLVIVRIPLGRSRSVAHQVRVERLGLEEEFVAAAFLLRQGIGRLIRREGVQGCKMWFLDGRIMLNGPRGATFSNMAKVLQFYPKKSSIVWD
jgi:CRISPR type IV-associated DEAD/DEAH-box helicase Csf4